MQLEPNLVYSLILSLLTIVSSKNTIDGIFSVRHKNRKNLIVISGFSNFLQIFLDIFQKFDLDNLVLKKPILVKEKNVSKRKKTLKSI